MIDLYAKYKIYVWIIAAAIVVFVTGWILYMVLVFQVASTNPAQGATITGGATVITFTFNRDIEKVDATSQVSASANIIQKVETNKNTLTVSLNNLTQNEDYQVFLKNIRATDGQLINLYTYKFHNKYVAYTDQSKQEQQKAVASTDKGNIDDPAIKALPKLTNHYSIKYELYGEPSQKGKYIKIKILLLLSNFDLTNKTIIAQRKAEALDYLRQNGVNPNDYVIEYDPAEAANL